MAKGDWLPEDGLRNFLNFYGQGDDETTLDSDSGWELGVRQFKWEGHDLTRVRRELTELLQSEGLTDQELQQRTTPFVPIPAGGSTRTWLTYLAARLAEAELDPGIPVGDFGWLNRGSEGTVHRGRFPDEQTANRASTLVLRAHEEQVRAWTVDPGGVPRLHLVADVGEGLGGPAGWVSALDDWGRDAGDPVETGTCVVLLQLAGPARPVVLTSYPEPPVDPAIRTRYPTLPALFGAFFNQDVIARDGTRWAAERIFHRDTAPAVVARVADELAALLADTDADDPALQAALHSLGSCTLAVDPRRWVRGLRRRITDLDWTA